MLGDVIEGGLWIEERNCLYRFTAAFGGSFAWDFNVQGICFLRVNAEFGYVYPCLFRDGQGLGQGGILVVVGTVVFCLNCVFERYRDRWQEGVLRRPFNCGTFLWLVVFFPVLHVVHFVAFCRLCLLRVRRLRFERLVAGHVSVAHVREAECHRFLSHFRLSLLGGQYGLANFHRHRNFLRRDYLHRQLEYALVEVSPFLRVALTYKRTSCDYYWRRGGW